MILVVIFVLLFLIVCTIPDKTEPFDAKILKISQDTCGSACTQFSGCRGFAFDPNTNTCWLSKSLISKNPDTSLFSQDYRTQFPRCNKIQSIFDTVTSTPDDFANNASYICAPSAMSTNVSYEVYAPNDKHHVIKSGIDGTMIKTVQDEDRNLVFRDQLTIKQEFKDVVLDPYNIYDVPWPNSIYTVLTPDDVKRYLAAPSKEIPIMVRKDEEYLGQYMYDHKCVKDIELKHCLSACANNPKCVGTEWNREFEDEGKVYHNVCCPKIAIGQIVPRRSQYKNGNFYLKERILPEDIKKYAVNDNSISIV